MQRNHIAENDPTITHATNPRVNQPVAVNRERRYQIIAIIGGKQTSLFARSVNINRVIGGIGFSDFNVVQEHEGRLVWDLVERFKK